MFVWYIENLARLSRAKLFLPPNPKTVPTASDQKLIIWYILLLSLLIMVVDEFIYTVKQFRNEIKRLINATLCNTSLFY